MERIESMRCQKYVPSSSGGSAGEVLGTSVRVSSMRCKYGYTDPKLSTIFKNNTKTAASHRKAFKLPDVRRLFSQAISTSWPLKKKKGISYLRSKATLSFYSPYLVSHSVTNAIYVMSAKFT